MNQRDDRVIVEVDENFIKTLLEWKRECLFIYGRGGIKKRIQEIISEDYKKLSKERR